MKEVLAISAEEHTTLCLKRYHAKKKTREIDTKLLDISNKITNEISSEAKTKSNSALLKKRNILESNKFQRKSAINTPQISIRNKEKLDHQPTVEEIKIATSSIQLRSLNNKRNSNISNGNSEKQNCEWQNKFHFQKMDKPPLPKEFKKSATLHEFPNPEYSETINPVCISTVSIQNEEIKKNESLNNFKSKIIHIQNTGKDLILVKSLIVII